ncbi:MAG: efflux RND transporter permease subunit, partial [Candidatus Cloacimonetes bacterium]|nr:efflux RND transporter permease subunit [Candidatus Cloacimonadota bacterium]
LALRKLIDEQVSYRLERVAGVAGVNVMGGLTREVHINIDALKLKALKIPLDQVIGQIRSANVNIPAGTVYRGNYQITVRVPGVFENLDELRNTIVLNRQGTSIALKDIAIVEESSSKVTRLVRINQKPGIQISVNKQSGTNTVKVAKGVINALEDINRSIPQVKVIPLMDTSVYISQSINNVTRSALEGGILAVLILLIFLRNLKSTIVIAAAIPISVMATFGLLYFNGFTLNLMTLGALALGIGQLLDNSIVVLENIFRHRELGKDPIEAAVFGAEEVTPPIIASTLTSVVVFLPLIFMQGMTGIMFKQLAYVIVFSLACSLVTALTLVPMLSSRMVSISSVPKVNSRNIRKRMFERIGNILHTMEQRFKVMLSYALDHRFMVSLIAIILLVGSILLVPFIGSELMPVADEGEIRVNLDMEAGTRLEIMDSKMKLVESRIAKIPEITNIVASVGGGGWGASSSNTAQMRISLVSRSQRNRSDEAVSGEIRKLLRNIAGVKVRVRTATNNQMNRVLGGGGGRIEIEVRGHDSEMAQKLAAQILMAVESVDGITDANLSRSAGAPEDLVLIDRNKAAELGLSVQQIAGMLETVLSGSSSGDFIDQGKEYPLVVRINEAENLPLNEVLDLSITNSAGQPIVLRNVVKIEQSQSSTVIERVDQERMIDVSANLSERSLGEVIKDIQAKLDEIPVPTGFNVEIAGDYKEQQKSFKELMVGFALALVLIYMVMASQYESLKDPFIVMFSVPLAVIGVALALFLTGTTFNIQSYIGCIMLGGIVVNNAILLVDTTNLLRRRDKMPVREAIEEAGRRRLRPILMTALATVLGMLPMAIGLGEGGEAQAPLARAVLGGMISSTLITLIIIPVVYSYFEEGLHRKKV